MNKKIRESAKILWNYNKLNHKLEKSDTIFVLGSLDPRVAERGAELFLNKMGDYLLLSGGQGVLTEDWKKSEVDTFAKIALSMGVPKEKIFIENKSTNTGENILFSYKLLKNKRINPQK